MESSPEIQQYLTLLADREAWHHWRSKHPDVQLNLARVVLMGVNLNEADVRNINFTRANLAVSKLHKADCRRTCFAGANLKGADLGGADLRSANLKWANLARTNLRRANLIGANLSGADLTGADLTGAAIEGANLDGVKLTGAVMPDGSLYGMVVIEAVATPEAEAPSSPPEAPVIAAEMGIPESVSIDPVPSEPRTRTDADRDLFPLARRNGKHQGSMAQLL